MTDSQTKRSVGRPAISDEPSEPFTVRLPAHVVALVKAAGGGSLSRGIIRQAMGQAPLSTVKRDRARARARASHGRESPPPKNNTPPTWTLK